MKPFDLQLAKQGHPVCTNTGEGARIVCFNADYPYPIIALIKNVMGIEISFHFTKDGVSQSGTRLVMKPKVHQLGKSMQRER